MNEENIVKKVCAELEINQAELARMVNVSTATISHWQSERGVPKMAKLALELMLENKDLKKAFQSYKDFQEIISKIK